MGIEGVNMYKILGPMFDPLCVLNKSTHTSLPCWGYYYGPGYSIVLFRVQCADSICKLSSVLSYRDLLSKEMT